MPAKVIHNSLPNEALVGIDPELLARVEVNWQHRLSLFTGRALTQSALDLEQANHSGLLALTGQLVCPGVIEGLHAAIDVSGEGPFCHIQPGSGITADGEDVHLATPMQTLLAGLAVAADGAMLEGARFQDLKQKPEISDFAGVLVLQPVVVTRADSPDGEDQPSFITDSCQSDPGSYAFQDWQLLDGSRLVFHTWPKEFLALPPTGLNWRNRVAYAIYERESFLEAGDTFPWENVGLPLAVLGFDEQWNPLFIDRYAVVRTGGYPRRRCSSPNPLNIRIEKGEFVAPYNPFLSEARIHQFAEELSEAAPATLADQFSFLPPVGVVPVSAVQLLERRNVSFPQHFHITAKPVHANELDGLILASANCSPIDLSEPEEIELLVPLPDGGYDPRLLFAEEVSPDFETEVKQSQEKRDEALRHRKDLRLRANALLKALGLKSITPDEDVSAQEKAAVDIAFTAPEGETFSTSPGKDADPFVSEDIETLLSTVDSPPYKVSVEVPQRDPKGAIVKDAAGAVVTKKKTFPLVSKQDLDDLDHSGLEHFIQLIQHRVDSANDLVDLAFLRSHTDIYRYRQHILSNANATRLATSPILAQIAQGTTVNATKDELQKYLDDARKSQPPAGPPPSYMLRAPNLLPIFSSGGISRSIGAKVMVAPPPPPKPAPPKVVSHTVTTARPIQSFIVRSPVRSAPGPAHVAPPPARPAPAPASMALAPQLRFLGTAGGLIPPPHAATVQPPRGPTTTDIRQDSPIIGAQLNFRTMSIAQRLQQSPSEEALFFSTANRLEVTDLLNDLEITVGDLPLLVDAQEQPPDPKKDPTINLDVWTLDDLKESKSSKETEANQMRGMVMARMLTPHVTADPDEAHLFGVGIRVLEQHTALLRAIEARIQLYQNFLQYARNLLKSIQDTLSQLDTRLKQVESDLDSARHDLAFATALLAEETQRVDGVNAKRAQVIQQYVTYLVFRRPPAVQATIELPTRPLYPALASSPVPACLGGRTGAPPELHDMLALLREAPVSWMPEMLALITRFNRPFLLQQLATTLRERAMVRQSAAPHTSYAQTQTGALPVAISHVYLKHQTVMANYRTARVYFDPSILEQETWLTQHGYMQRLASIGDLLESHYAAPAVTRAAANLFQQIGSVAGCLYQRVGTVGPIFRLRWAERLADTNSHTDLHNLAVLPTWSNVDYVLRRELQGYVGWLFARLQPSIPEAAGYMSDLVRVCILVASHAPVDEIIHGEAIGKAPLNVGNVVKIAAVSPRIFHGMQVLLYDNKMQLAAHGTVADLSNAEIAVQVVKVLKQEAVNSTIHHAQFVTTSIPLHGASHPLR